MRNERILILVLIIIGALSLVTVSLVAADTLADDNAPGSQTQSKETAPEVANRGGQSIMLTKTVGLDASSCADTKTIVVAPGTPVTYCYKVRNTGSITLGIHDLEDSELGTILSGFSFQLQPGSTAFLTQSAVISDPTVNVATWMAYNPGPTDTVSTVDAATVIANDLNTCRFPGLPIPDNEVTGTSDIMNVNAAGTVVDLDIYLETEHTWVGDLEFTLEHVGSGITATLVDRPGVPDSTFGCSADDMRAIIDDEATAAVEDTCNTPIALAGRFVGGDPADSSLLTAFDGQELMGQWQLHVSDNASGDVGTLDSWCLLPTLAEPDISLNPTSLASTQPPDTQTMHTLIISNSGDAPLAWAIHESSESAPTAASPVPFSSQLPPPSSERQLEAAQETIDDEAAQADAGQQPAFYGPVAAPPISVLYDNGPLINAPGGGAGGADASVLQSISLGMSTLGFGHQAALGASVADDFTVTDPNGWYIDEITFFAYQTGSPLTSTMTAVNYRIWDGPPDDSGSSIVFGQSMPNRLVDTQWSGIYRVSETSLDSVIRPIMQNTTSGGTVLGPGTYWLEWQTDGDPLLSGPWLPPVTISGVVTTGNALQNFNGAWGSVLDGGTTAPQDLPFIISGYALTDIPWATAEPVSGTLPSGTTDVMVTFDSTGLSNGVYTGTLLVANNDPDTPLIPVPITLTVDFLHTYLPFVTKN